MVSLFYAEQLILQNFSYKGLTKRCTRHVILQLFVTARFS